MVEALAFLAAAAIFATARVAVIARLNRPAWPWGTLAVNIFGSLTAAVVVARAPQSWSTLVGIAALGAFTTFSTFAVEVAALWRQGPARAVGYGIATTIGAVAAAVVGLGL